jgi:NADH-quinone oxidoreductase subunit C
MSEQAIERIKDKFGDAVTKVLSRCGDDTATVKREKWLEAAAYARDELGFDLFVDLTAVDYLGREEGLERFEVVLHLRNMESGKRIRLKSRVPAESPMIASLISLYKGANWFERECHEMYGIEFMGHPDLRPLLLYPEFKGHPLRKDYPIDKRQPIVPLRAPEERRFGRPMDETPHGHDPRFIDKGKD